MYGGRDGKVWEMSVEKCGEDVEKCVGGMERVEKCGVDVEKYVEVWVRGDVGKCVAVWGRCREVLGEVWGSVCWRSGEVCWGVGGDVGAGAARSEGCKGCSLPSLSPPYFFFKKQNFFTYSCLSYNYRQYFF